MSSKIKSPGVITFSFPGSSFDSIESICHYLGDSYNPDVVCSADTTNKIYTLSNLPFDTNGEY